MAGEALGGGERATVDGTIARAFTLGVMVSRSRRFSILRVLLWTPPSNFGDEQLYVVALMRAST